MPVTRSITRSRAATTSPVVNVKRASQHQSAESDPVVPTKRSRSRSSISKAKAKKSETEGGGAPRPLIKPSGEELAPLPAKLTFSLEDAKNHLIQADDRFKDAFSRLPCKPFEKLESVHPFRTLCTSIIGQQISWLAARAILHKFLKLYFPELPDKPDDQYWTKTIQDNFPTAYQVATTDLATLKTVGLSGRKAEYVRDLATRFADGRLSNQKLFDANDEELFELLTAVYGIGKWTVEMFAIFSLQRPDILPAGDLGVQRGLLRWMLSLHQPEYRIGLSPKKLPDPTEDSRKADDKPSNSKPKPAKSRTGAKAKGGVSASKDQEVDQEADELPGLNGLTDTTTVLVRAPDAPPPPPLPAGLTVASLRSRLDGKKKIKGAILTPSEMEALTEPWRPYRSIGVYYMWALAEEKAAS